ncbi:MAG: alpha-L-fucosidase [Bryobacter sp.]|nr:alpha-L-fucosidase [Bryobacter sp.]
MERVSPTVSRRAALLGSLAAIGARGQDAAAINQELAARKPALVPTTHADAQWFPNAGLGLFLHWGIASVHGNIDLSWGMMKGLGNGVKITPEEYFRLAERFRPERWDPDRMMQAAARAGFRYAVLTTKHHEGFALWPSRFGEFNTTKFAGGMDLVKPFVEACRKHGIRVGFYYSPGDWYYAREYMSFHYRSAHCWQNTGLGCRPDVPDFNTRFEPVTLPPRTAKFEREFRDYKRGQIRELLTRYGKVDLLWFDMTDVVMTPEEIRELQPGIVINNRMGSGTGDFLTPEGSFPKQRPEGWWELCAIWSSPYWGYVKSNEERYLPTGSFLATLAKARSWSGNLLMNAAPRPDGAMPGPFWKGMEELAGWMEHSKAAVFGVSGGPWPEECPCPVTTKGDTRYLLVPPDWKQASVELRSDRRAAGATLLRTGAVLPVTQGPGRITVGLPPESRTAMVDVVALRLAP